MAIGNKLETGELSPGTWAHLMPYPRFATFLCSALAWGVGFGLTANCHGADRLPRLKTRHVILVTTDGFRWQEVFGGADELLLSQTNSGMKNVDRLRRRFAGPTPQAGR